MNNKHLVKVDYNNLLFPLFKSLIDINIDDGIAEEIISKTIKERYDETFDINDLPEHISLTKILLYLKSDNVHYPDSLNDFYNSLSDFSFSDLQSDKQFKEGFTKKAIEAILPNIFDLNLICDFNKRCMIKGNVLEGVKVSSELRNQASIINYLIACNYEKIKLESIWEECLEKYLTKSGLDLSILKDNPTRNSIIQRDVDIDDFITVHKDLIKFNWVNHKERYLDLKTLNILTTLIIKNLTNDNV